MAQVLVAQPVPNIVPIPPLVIGVQPNFGILNDHIQGVAQEVALLQNLPAFDIQQQLQHLQDQSNLVVEHLQQLTNTVNGMQNAVIGMQNAVIGIQHTLDRQPQQLYNSTASIDAPLLYPQGIQILNAFPSTKKDLMNLTTANCNAVLTALGMVVPAPGTPIAARRQVLMDYLGTGMRA